MLTVETAVIPGLYLIAFVDYLIVPIATEKVSRIRLNIMRNLRKEQCALPKVNTERFMTSYVNRLIFKHNERM